MHFIIFLSFISNKMTKNKTNRRANRIPRFVNATFIVYEAGAVNFNERQRIAIARTKLIFKLNK